MNFLRVVCGQLFTLYGVEYVIGCFILGAISALNGAIVGFCIVAFVVALCVFSLEKSYGFALLWGAGFFCLGILRVGWLFSHSNVVMMAKTFARIDGQGVVSFVKPTLKGQQFILKGRWKFYNTTPFYIPQKILFFSPGPQRVAAGDLISFKGAILHSFIKEAPFSRNERREYWFKGVGGRGFVKDFTVTKQGAVSGLEKQINQLRLFIESFSKRGIVGQFVASLVTGNQGLINFELKRNFRALGIGHLLAVSGVHMAIVGGVLYALALWTLSFCYLPFSRGADVRKWAAFVGILGIIFYSLLVQGSVSALRSAIMFGIVLLGFIVWRRPFSMRTFMVALGAITLIFPGQLLTVSCQLSFVMVGGIILALPLSIKKYGKWKGSFVLSLMASIISLPLTLYYFHEFSVISPFANMIVIPLFSIFIMPAVFFWFLLSKFSASFIVLKAIVGPFLKGIALLSAKAGGFIHAVYFSWKWLILCYGLLIVSMGKFFKKSVRVCAIGLFFAIIVFLILRKGPDIVISEDGHTVFLKTLQHHYVLVQTYPDQYVKRSWQLALNLNPKLARHPHCKHYCQIKTIAGSVYILAKGPFPKAVCDQVGFFIVLVPFMKKCPNKQGVNRAELWKSAGKVGYINDFLIQWKSRSVKRFYPWQFKGTKPTGGF